LITLAPFYTLFFLPFFVSKRVRARTRVLVMLLLLWQMIINAKVFVLKKANQFPITTFISKRVLQTLNFCYLQEGGIKPKACYTFPLYFFPRILFLLMTKVHKFAVAPGWVQITLRSNENSYFDIRYYHSNDWSSI